MKDTPDCSRRLPAALALAVGRVDARLLSAEGELQAVDHRRAADLMRNAPAFVCHGRATARRLGLDPVPSYDLLELFAFARPATFVVPTAQGLSAALALPPPRTLDDQPIILVRAAAQLLDEITALDGINAVRCAELARAMRAGGWPWAEPVLNALGEEPGGDRFSLSAFAIWDRLPEWQEFAPLPPPAEIRLDPEDVRQRLQALIGRGAENRPEQADYAVGLIPAFDPRDQPDQPRVVLAEAGTGVGKTLGYVAPASLWAERAEGTIWFSTFTRNLQHQVDRELERLIPDPDQKRRRVVVRKGRENYFCLLNMEDRVRNLRVRPHDAIALGLMARWGEASRDGDMTGGDFPSWLVEVLGGGLTLGLADRRGECIYSACPHYGTCFVERTVRRARRAQMVIANHALVMVQAALGSEDMNRITRFVFDEGHHLFDAADSAFSAHLSGSEGAELRRWLLGAEDRRRSRSRGLSRRIEDLIAGDDEAERLVRRIAKAARALPGDGWRQRMAGGQTEGPAETFLAEIRRLVYARSADTESPYGLEADPRPADGALLGAAHELQLALDELVRPVCELIRQLEARLADDAADLDSDTRRRIEATCRSLTQRAAMQAGAWRDMLASLESETPPEFVDWLSVDRFDGRDIDVGMHRHWLDPTVPFAAHVARPAHGMIVTSATLRDGSGNAEENWRAAERRSGTDHLPAAPIRLAVTSPFDYPNATRVFVVTDVRKDDMAQVAAAYRVLFLAAGGGALGLFTAIARLRDVHRRIADAIDEAGLSLLAQHVDPMNTATLVEMFRADPDACLLGTDAVRDGVDVPGEALRLIVFDRVPWPRPTILHRARRAAMGGRAYDDMLTRLRLKQAFGRLIRRAGDRGVFVLLDPMMPSRLAGAFPEGVAIERMGLADAVAAARTFLRESLQADEKDA